VTDFINSSVEKIENSDYQEKAQKYAKSAEQDLKKVVSELNDKKEDIQQKAGKFVGET
jgi:hypothetical protein